jgi:hypothetical protein
MAGRDDYFLRHFAMLRLFLAQVLLPQRVVIGF